MKNNFFFRPIPLVLALHAVFAAPSTQGASFTVPAATTDTAGKTLTTGDTGTVYGTLSVGGNAQAITVTGTNGTVTINNFGLIEQTGTSRAVRNNTNGVTLVVNNNAGASIKAVGDDVFKVGQPASIFKLTNQGTIWQTGMGTGSGQALDLRDITSSSGNFVINGSPTNDAALIRADGDDAIRPGSNTTITNYGTIISNGMVNTKCPDYLGNACAGKPSAHDAIDLGSSTGVEIENYGIISGPRHAITADKSVIVTNYSSGQIIGRNGSGVGSDGTGTVTNYGLISGRYAGAGNAYDHLGNGATINNGDGDGVDIDGVGTIINYGRIEGLGGGGFDNDGNPNGGDGVALGGGTVTNHVGAVIWGESNGILVDDGANGTDTTNPAANKNRGTSSAQAAAVTITNSGAIIGGRKVAIGLVGNWNDEILNNATGVIIGGPDTLQVNKLSTDPTQTPGAAIQMGDGDDTLENHGYIQGLNGKAIDMGNGDDTLKLFAGGSTGIVVGTIDGGAGIDTLETGGTQTFSPGTLSGFENFIVRNGTTTFDYGLGTVLSVTVDPGATLKVEGPMSTSGNFTINGTFKATTVPTLRTILVGGNYMQGPTSDIEVGVGRSNQSDKIIVAGNATISNGATITPIAREFIPDGATYTIIVANGGLTVTPENLTVPVMDSYLRYYLSSVGNELKLQARRTTLNEIAIANNSSLSSLGNALDTISKNNGNADNLLNALYQLKNEKAIISALNQVAPDINDDWVQASHQSINVVFSAIEKRIDLARSGLAVGDNRDRRFWIQGIDSWGRQDPRASANGYKINAVGIAGGIEADRSAKEVMGLTIGYAHATTQGKGAGSGDDFRVNAVYGGGYFSQVISDFTLDASVVFGYGDFRSERMVTFPGFSEKLTGDYHGWQFGGRIEAGFPIHVDSQWSARWLLGARAGYITTGSYEENGNISVAQRIDDNSARSLQSVLGIEFNHQYYSKSIIQLRTRYLHEFAGAPDIKASFVVGGPEFTLSSVKPNRDTLQLGIGYRRVAENGVVFTLGYDAEVKKQYLSHQILARASWMF